MFTQMRAAFASERARVNAVTNAAERGRPPAQLTAQQMLDIATDQRRARGRAGERTGSLTPGKKADVVLLDAGMLNVAPVIDPVAAVMLSADVSNVDTVIVNGVVQKRGGKLLADVAKARRLVDESRDYLVGAASGAGEAAAAAPRSRPRRPRRRRRSRRRDPQPYERCSAPHRHVVARAAEASFAVPDHGWARARPASRAGRSSTSPRRRCTPASACASWRPAARVPAAVALVRGVRLRPRRRGGAADGRATGRRLGAGDYALVPVGVAHSWHNTGPEPGAVGGDDRRPSRGTASTATRSPCRPSRRRRRCRWTYAIPAPASSVTSGPSTWTPTSSRRATLAVSASMRTALLVYSGITVKMMVDSDLGADLTTMFMVQYATRRRRRGRTTTRSRRRTCSSRARPRAPSTARPTGSAPATSRSPGPAACTGSATSAAGRCAGWRPRPRSRRAGTRTGSPATGTTYAAS